MKKILFAASECVPFIKTGGLADVVGALPKGFDKSEFDVRVVLPFYTSIPAKYRSQCRYLTHFYMSAGEYMQNKYVGVMTGVFDGITYYFVDCNDYFSGDRPYGAVRRDIEKFCYFSKAALSILPIVNFRPDIIHCHDWQTGVIPAYIKTEFTQSEFFWNIKTIMTIHNLKFQGVWNVETIKGFTGLPDWCFRNDTMEYHEDANMLKGGIVYADYVTTVSDSYAREIQMPYYGEGLDGLLSARSNDLYGIVNGIDYDIYDPEKDEVIAENYNSGNFVEKKALNKEALQRELGLPVDRNKFMIAIISRLTDQKGLDLIKCVMDGIVREDVQFVVIGTGDVGYENMFRHYEWVYKDRISANILYSDQLAHKLYAAADVMLMPSKFEPCGLTQLISLRYGTVPIVRETGGLRDTVWPYNEYEGTGTGFSFANYNAHEMLHVIEYAKMIYYNNKEAWNGIVKRGMETDFSWKVSIEKYKALYNRLLGEGGEPQEAETEEAAAAAVETAPEGDVPETNEE